VSAARLTRLWWIRLPLAARRLSLGLAVTLLDGSYLVAWPWAAAIATPLAFILGLVAGALHPGFGTAFTESLPLLIVVVVVGALSGHLGAMLWLGFVLGDFFIFHDSWTTRGGIADFLPFGLLRNIVNVRVPLLIEYGLLGLATMVFPVLGKTLLVQLTPLARLGRAASLAAAAIVQALLTYALVFFWAQSTALLIRPVFTWREANIPAGAIAPLQEQGMLLASLALAAAVARVGLQGLTAFAPTYSRPLNVVERAMTEARPVTPLAERLPVAVVAAARALTSWLLLAGLYETWVDAAILGLLILLISLARHGLLRLPLGPWPDLAQRLPLLLRLAAGFFIVAYIAQLLDRQLRSAESFRPIMLLTGLALVIFYLVNPLAPIARRAPAGAAPTIREQRS
jgi:hypothetical protein